MKCCALPSELYAKDIARNIVCTAAFSSATSQRRFKLSTGVWISCVSLSSQHASTVPSPSFCFQPSLFFLLFFWPLHLLLCTSTLKNNVVFPPTTLTWDLVVWSVGTMFRALLEVLQLRDGRSLRGFIPVTACPSNMMKWLNILITSSCLVTFQPSCQVKNFYLWKFSDDT